MSIRFKDGSLEQLENNLKNTKKGIGLKIEKARRSELKNIDGTLPYRPVELIEKEINSHKNRLLKHFRKEAATARYKDGRRVVKSSDITAVVSKRRYIRGSLHSSRFDETPTMKKIDYSDPRADKHLGEYRYSRDVKAMYVPIKIFFTGKTKRQDMTDAEDFKDLRSSGGYIPFPAYTSARGGDYYYKQSKSPKLNKTTYGVGTFIYMPYLANNQPIAKDYVYWTDYTANPIGYYKYGKNAGKPIYPRYRSEKQWRNGRNKAAKGFVKRAALAFSRESEQYRVNKNGYRTVVSISINPIYK